MLADIHSLAFKILDRFMKDEALARIKSTSDFCTFDVKEPSGHVHINKIKIDIVAESLLKELKFQKKVSDLQIRGFREACKKTLISFMSKFLDKSPLKYKFVTYLSCLDPEVIMANKAEATIKMRRILLEMVEKRAFPLSERDEILEEFSMLIDSALTSGSLAQFSKDNDRLDTFYHDQLAHRRFSKVGPVIKQLLLLSHGQATVERDFSVNKELEDSNLNEHTLIARRLIVDFINSVGGIDNVEITPKLLVNAGSAYSRYKMYLDAEKEKKEKAQRGLKWKHLDTEIEELSKKKKALMSDTAALNASADDYALRAENEWKISHIIHSNSLKKRAKEKEDEIKEVERLLDNKLLELKSSL